MRNLVLAAGTSYFLAVADAKNIQGSFDLCLQLSENSSQCNLNSSLEVKQTSLGSNKTGPYKPGEQVEFCYTIDGYNNVSCNYLHAIIPLFGEGWDDSSFNSVGQPAQMTKALETQGHTTSVLRPWEL